MLPSEDSRNGAFDLKSSQIANIEPINIALAADNKPYKPLYTKDMNIYRVSLFDYDRAFDLEIFAQTEEEAKAMALREEPYMTIQRVVCLT